VISVHAKELKVEETITTGTDEKFEIEFVSSGTAIRHHSVTQDVKRPFVLRVDAGQFDPNTRILVV
jgi:hypothetical protein